jgi:cyclopropane fatty-acyl-phospholipid synthase-like methyltransferase
MVADMPIAKLAHDAKGVAVACMTWGGSQNFLGASWVAHLVENSPERIRQHIALRVLSLSPHYFYSSDIRAEAERNRQSRQALVEALLSPHLNPDARVIDYGCGPGYMARAVAARVRCVEAIDISPGVLACARVLNGSSNITYCTPTELRDTSHKADLAYSFAVIQHMGTDVLSQMLELLARKLNPKATLLLHFAVPGPNSYRTEGDWKADHSLAGRMKLRYGLHCFGRSVCEMETLVRERGFADVTVQHLSGTLRVPGDNDIPQQHLLTARRA